MQHEDLAKQMAGEVVLSEEPWKVLKELRTRYKIRQIRLAREMGVTPSVVSDYESGRRKSIGVAHLKTIITAILEIHSGAAAAKVNDSGGEEKVE